MDTLIEEALHDVGLDKELIRLLLSFPVGMRKRLGLARTLILKPEIMLYDDLQPDWILLHQKGISKSYHGSTKKNIILHPHNHSRY